MTGRTNTKPQRPPGKARLKALIDEGIVDAYNESEQRTAFYTLLDEHLDTQFETQVLSVTAIIERIDMTADEQIVAICRRGRSRQAVPVLDLRLPKPPPAGAQWIEAYRLWITGK